jgi:hypothetical protein
MKERYYLPFMLKQQTQDHLTQCEVRPLLIVCGLGY